MSFSAFLVFMFFNKLCIGYFTWIMSVLFHVLQTSLTRFHFMLHLIRDILVFLFIKFILCFIFIYTNAYKINVSNTFLWKVVLLK